MEQALQDNLESVQKLNKSLVKSLYQDRPGGVTDNEARFLVDTYYSTQKARIRNQLQVSALHRDAKKTDTDPEPHEHLSYFVGTFNVQEENIKKVLAYYVSNHPMGWFFEKTLGVGPVLAAGLLAFIDIKQAPTVGHIWNFAGLNPGISWGKGQKRPWNATLKTICWKISDSFVKTSGREDSFYGQLYKKRKAKEWESNLCGEYVEQAKASMRKKDYGKDTDQYAWYTGKCSPVKARGMLESGVSPSATGCTVDEGGMPMLSPAHIDARAKRYAVKMFLSHLHECWYRQHFGEEPPKPFAISILGHGHYMRPPQLSAG